MKEGRVQGGPSGACVAAGLFGDLEGTGFAAEVRPAQPETQLMLSRWVVIGQAMRTVAAAGN